MLKGYAVLAVRPFTVHTVVLRSDKAGVHVTTEESPELRSFQLDHTQSLAAPAVNETIRVVVEGVPY